MKYDINRMTLREKIGQTAIPAPPAMQQGGKEYGYAEYLKRFPYGGFFVEYFYKDHGGERFDKGAEFAAFVPELQKQMNIPLFVCCDAEFGVKGEIFKDGHLIPAAIATAAANDQTLAYRRGYYWGREMRALGMNWVFGPVGDLSASFFATHAPRSFSDDPEKTARMVSATVRGLQDAGMAATTKHYPGTGHEFRDSHFSFCAINDTLEEWSGGQKKVWQAAENAGTKTFMTGHLPLPCVDPEPVVGRFLRPGSASEKVIDILRDDIGHKGVVICDAVSMKSLAATFDHDDVYVECFNAGNDIILFTHDDYFDIMERAIAAGKVTMERLDEAVTRILTLKEELGLFDGNFVAPPMTAEENAALEQMNFDVAARSLTLVNNDGLIPFDKTKIKKVSVIGITEYEPFIGYLDNLKKAFESHGIHCTVQDHLRSKAELETLCAENDLILYACYINQQRPYGFPGFSSGKPMSTLFNAYSFGNEKSVTVSFGHSSVYYNYFESVGAYIDAYSDSPETMRAVVMALLGDLPFPGVSPMRLRPELV